MGLASARPSEWPAVRAIIFDGDDTLWSTEHLYDAARAHARQLVEAAGQDGARWEEFERRIDVENVPRFGHSIDRFPTSCVEAYDATCRASDEKPNVEVRKAVRLAAGAVFEQPAPLLPGAAETLRELRSRGFRLALLTKGDRNVQLQRIEQSGLSALFDVIKIVNQKTAQDIKAVLDRLGVDADSALSVGNSIRSDVVPSLAAGVRTVWIDAHVWEYERDHDEVSDERVVAVDNLNELLEVAL